ncbi:hypothetical protein F3Y22_tig00011547pilonHSYRG00025 [Hibiscus syriacus]|uniref:Uncharacterized protein n=1 Tax=Hibiscus syriacus TaxID=106335 RepID=A0A6A3C642_HIBSY|nr:uncharacterized protein LOC120204719 [Hibiscus syriacus]XP_039060681.1 uncharacterized protein LOC120204719 [Hibiscus syriacus]KAE8723907.1 hypothetical protein F3Y22_tig00011547pilonHSYRG00025 [Hibiscus syriacus]
MTIQQQNQGQQSRVFHDLSALVLNLLGVPPTATALFFSDQSPGSERRRYPRTITPAGFGWLMLGISVSMMFCGSITFFIGLMLMPWVVGLAIVLYVAGIVSTVWPFDSLLCHRPSLAAQGYSCMIKQGLVRELKWPATAFD